MVMETFHYAVCWKTPTSVVFWSVIFWRRPRFFLVTVTAVMDNGTSAICLAIQKLVDSFRFSLQSFFVSEIVFLVAFSSCLKFSTALAVKISGSVKGARLKLPNVPFRSFGWFASMSLSMNVSSRSTSLVSFSTTENSLIVCLSAIVLWVKRRTFTLFTQKTMLMLLAERSDTVYDSDSFRKQVDATKTFWIKFGTDLVSNKQVTR